VAEMGSVYEILANKLDRNCSLGGQDKMIEKSKSFLEKLEHAEVLSMLQAVRLWVLFPTTSFDFSIDLLFLVALWSWGQLSL
jgi:hypothetical protein